MVYAVIGGNYYGHVSDYLFAPTWGYTSYGYPSDGYSYGSREHPYYW